MAAAGLTCAESYYKGVRMKLAVVVACSVAALALAAPAGLAAGTSAQTRVVCINQDTLAKEYKVTPRHCIFHRRHTPKAEAFFVRTKRDHWRVWGDQRARGRGRSQPSMG